MQQAANKEQLAVLLLVAERLASAGILYMVTGSVAASLYGPPRTTRDIDLVVEVSPKDVDRLYALFERDFYVDRDSMRQAVEQCGIFNIIHHDSVVKVDLIVRKDAEYDLQALQRRRVLDIGERKVCVASPEDLILSKLVWAKESRSEMQLRDVREVARSVPDLDRGYLQTWAGRLGVAQLYRETC